MDGPALIWLLQGGKKKAKPAEEGASPITQAPEALGEASEAIQQQAEQLLPEGLKPEPEQEGISTVQLGLAFGVIFIALLLRWLVAFVISRVYSRAIKPTRPGPFMISPTAAAAQEERKRGVERVLRVASFVILLTGLFFALSLLDLPTAPTNWEQIAWRIYTSLLLVFAGALVFQFFTLVLRVFTKSQTGLDSGILDRQLSPLVLDLAKFALGILVILFVLQTWGYDTTALLAGVGIGGLALAFAAQDAISNVFGSLVIYSDRPYKVGDWVTIGDTTGIVEEIGIRSTRIRMFDKSLCFVPNKSVANEKIYNHAAMTHRRIRFHLGVTYDLGAEKLEETLATVREVVAWQRGIEADTWLVHFEEFGASSQNILIQCFTRQTDYAQFLQLQEELLLEMRRRLDNIGVDIAFPTQTIIYKKEGGLQPEGGPLGPAELQERGRQPEDTAPPPIQP